jgi:hypothetical protein
VVWGKWDRSKLIIQERKWGGHLQVIIHENVEMGENEH